MRIKCRVTGVIWMLIFLGGCQVMEKEEAGWKNAGIFHCG